VRAERARRRAILTWKFLPVPARLRSSPRRTMRIRAPLCPGTPVAEGNVQGGEDMNNIFYIIGVVVVILFILGYLGLR